MLLTLLGSLARAVAAVRARALRYDRATGGVRWTRTTGGLGYTRATGGLRVARSIIREG